MNLPSYPKIWNIGHPSVGDLFRDDVLVQEKVDGSQLSFAIVDGALAFRSKGAEVIPGAAGMFSRAVEALSTLPEPLNPDFIYRGEYLAKPKHNALAYGRVPLRHVVLFDISSRDGKRFLNESEVLAEAARLGMEAVPTFFFGRVDSAAQLRSLLERTSFLGEAKVEGVVVKNYTRWHIQTSDTLMGKFVSEAFKEAHSSSWRVSNPTKADIVAALVTGLATERRWAKAVEHRRDLNLLESAPQDIGPLIHDVQADVEAECKEEILEALWSWAWPQVKRKVAAGLPEWYKQRLLDGAFTTEAS